jgi:hypothetical protein
MSTSLSTRRERPPATNHYNHKKRNEDNDDDILNGDRESKLSFFINFQKIIF